MLVTVKAVKMEEPGVELKQLLRKEFEEEEWGGGERDAFGEEEVFIGIPMSEREKEDERENNNHGVLFSK